MKEKKITAIDIINDDIKNNIEGLFELINSSSDKWKKGWNCFNTGLPMPRNYVSDRAYIGGATVFQLHYSKLYNPEIEGEKRTGYYVTLKQAFDLGWKLKESCKHTKSESKKILDEIRSISIPVTPGEEQDKIISKKRSLIAEFLKKKVYFIVPFFNIKEKEVISDEEKDENGEPKTVIEKKVITSYYEVYPIEAFIRPKEIKGREKIIERPENLHLDIGEKVSAGIKCLNDYCAKENIEVRLGGTKCCYLVGEDIIKLPSFDDFKTDKDIFDNFAHEACHSTGSSKRLKRFGLDASVFDEYSKEELVAELGAVMLSQKFDILDENQFKNNIAYLKGFLDRVGSNKNDLLKAMNDADRAVQFIVNTSVTEGGN